MVELKRSLNAIQKLLRAHAGTDKLPSKIPNAYEGRRRVVGQKISVDWLAVASPASEPIQAGKIPSVDNVVREFVTAGVMDLPRGDNRDSVRYIGDMLTGGLKRQHLYHFK